MTDLTAHPTVTPDDRSHIQDNSYSYNPNKDLFLVGTSTTNSLLGLRST